MALLAEREEQHEPGRPGRPPHSPLACENHIVWEADLIFLYTPSDQRASGPAGTHSQPRHNLTAPETRSAKDQQGVLGARSSKCLLHSLATAPSACLGLAPCVAQMGRYSALENLFLDFSPNLTSSRVRVLACRNVI